jgi:selenium metabolism protein YedF
MVTEGEIMEIDCRGMACPQPIVVTKRALEQLNEGELTVILDDPTAHDNVERYVRSQGCSVRTVKRDQEVTLHIRKGLMSGGAEPVRAEEASKRIVVYINSHLLGVGDEALGSILMGTFLKTLLEMETRPNRLILINSGVRLASEGSEVLETLKKLSEKGVDIVSCGTCLDFYGLKEKLKVGRVSNMYDIAQSLLGADRLIRP